MKAYGKDPTKDSQLTRRAAVLCAQGAKSDKEIATELKMSEEEVLALRESPMFQQLVVSYGEEMVERGVETVVKELTHDAPRNIRFLKQVRDGDFTDTKDRMDSRLRASKFLLDKQVPNADSAKVSENAIQVVVGGKLLEQMLRALRNAGEDVPLDITPPKDPDEGQ